MQEKETRVKFNPALSANRPSNNWALNCKYPGGSHTIYCNDITVNCMGLSRILTVQAICVPSCLNIEFEIGHSIFYQHLTSILGGSECPLSES